jgi:hypothetical protein
VLCIVLLQVENCNQSTSCCDGFNASASNPAASCTLSCSTVARLRPPYVNNVALRARKYYPIPTPDPGASPAPRRFVLTVVGMMRIALLSP